MMRVACSRAFAWLVAAAFCLPPCSHAADREIYVLFVELTKPYEANRATLLNMLQVEGYEAYTESDREVSLALTAGDIRKLFNARVVRRTLEKSATRGTASRPALEGARIPGRFKKLIRSVSFDPQRG